MERAELDPHPELEEPVQVAQRLVEQEHRRLGNQGTRQCDALLLPAGELLREPITQVGEVHEFQGLGNPLLSLRRGKASHLQAELDVFRHRLMRKESVVLEDGRDVALGSRDVVEPHPVEQDIACVGHLVATDHPQEGRLAAAGWAEQDDVAATGNCQIDVIDGCGRTETLRDAAEHHRPPLATGRHAVLRRTLMLRQDCHCSVLLTPARVAHLC